jgi:hypothetical protein
MFWQWDGEMYRISEFGSSIPDFDKRIKVAGIKYLVSGLNLMAKLISYQYNITNHLLTWKTYEPQFTNRNEYNN